MTVDLLLALPLILLSLPVVLPLMAWQERRRRCPTCGRRGTLEVVRSLAQSSAPGEGQPTDWLDQEFEREEPDRPVRRRINPANTRLRCALCGSEFSRTELAGLGVPV